VSPVSSRGGQEPEIVVNGVRLASLSPTRFENLKFAASAARCMENLGA
jgi:hypothetical protein